MMKINEKKKILERYTANTSVIKELSDYTNNKFVTSSENFNFGESNFPDEEHIPVWEEFVEESKKLGVYTTLKQYFPQLSFPIQKNISQSENYRAATLKGKPLNAMTDSEGFLLEEPNELELFIYPSIAGKIPVLIVPNNNDFVRLIQAFTYRNEPVKIPKSMGAAMLNGLNNWGRIHRMKREWSNENPLDNWNTEFRKNILPNKYLYQDKIILLSKKPYSGVSGKSLGISHEDWINHSIQIRLEHECTHFFTLKTFGKMANNMHDELLADYIGISKGLGKFNSDWFLRFLGLENYPEYREGGRLQNYVSDPPLSQEAIPILRTIVKKAAINLERFDESLGATKDTLSRVQRLLSICTMDLLEVSEERAYERLLEYHNTKCQLV